ncbi:MAG: SpoIVB peptidase [Ruminococcaceae bacterium]|nr:SpoIVB peptidase [Oscillospiraceae bacterium]
MIRKIAKASLSFVMILFFVFLNLVGLGDYLYPDTVSLFTGETPESVLCFSCESEENGAIPAQGQVLAFGVIPVKEVSLNYYEKTELLCGGDLFGLRMETRGLLVTGIDSIKTGDKSVSPGKDAGLKKGDVILKADGMELKSAATFSKIIAKSEGKSIRLTVERGEEALELTLTPALSADAAGYRAGLWVRDGAAGIGTVTFIDPKTGAFGGLGHPVCDSETGIPFPFGSGSVCHAQVESITKGGEGSPGELKGSLEQSNVGVLTSNSPQGVYGILDEKTPKGGKSIPIGLKNQVKPGKASILCTLDGSGKKEYEIEIEEIIGKDRDSKNFVLRITDPALLKMTGGIVQGMSGSPIIQNGKLIGAVTHVLVGDPTRGYGIFIENMLSNMPE